YNAAFLRDADKLNEFKIVLNNRFEALQDLIEEETNMEKNGEGSNKHELQHTWRCCGREKHHQKEWISIGTVGTIQEVRDKKTVINHSRTRSEKVKGQVEYTEANKRVKRSIIGDRRKYMEDLATTAEKAVREVSMRQLYDTTKKLSRECSEPEQSVEEEIRKRHEMDKTYVAEIIKLHYEVSHNLKSVGRKEKRQTKNALHQELESDMERMTNT
ncbi:unnamed protein product, partial [Schistosoma curassoni]|uniref:DUF4201 domain-containing protein n=1 Tax=Schistosoma curassoni TaxID=6186 RepID=A0A183JTR6_9TREM